LRYAGYKNPYIKYHFPELQLLKMEVNDEQLDILIHRRIL